jgi:hypothetical protein
MGITKLKKYQVEEDNNSNLSIVKLISNDHGKNDHDKDKNDAREDKDDAGEDKDNTNKQIIKTELTQSEKQISTKEQPIPR